MGTFSRFVCVRLRVNRAVPGGVAPDRAMPKRKAVSPSPSLDPAGPCAVGQFWLTENEVDMIREKMMKMRKTWRWEWRVEEVCEAESSARSKKRMKQQKEAEAKEAKEAKAREVQARKAAEKAAKAAAKATAKAKPKAAPKTRPAAKAKPKAAPKAKPKAAPQPPKSAARNTQAAQEMVPPPQPRAQTIGVDDHQSDSDTDNRTEETGGEGVTWRA